MKKIVSLVLACVMILSCLAGCGGDSNSSNGTNTSTPGTNNGDNGGSGTTENVTIRVFDKNSGSKTFDDEVAQYITEKTGVKLEIESPTGDPSEKLNLMLSGQNYPDIVLMGQGEIVNRYIEAGALIELDDLIEQYGTNIKAMYGDTLNKTRYTDGHNYWLANWYGLDPDASAGVLMRRDILAQIVGQERAESPEPFTVSEYIDILKQVKEQFPQLQGRESIPLTLDADAGNYVGTYRGMFGMKTYYEHDGQLEHNAKDPAFLQAMYFMNDLYTQGLLDKEWVVNHTEQWEQKLSGGYVFSSFNSYWDTDGINTTLAATISPDAQFFCYKVVPDGADPASTTYNGRSSLGWDAIGITKNCKNVDAAMQLIDFLASEEGQYLLLWGVEGKHWNMEDGKHVPVPEIYEGLQNEFDKTSNETGIRKWTWFIKNGNGSDGTPYDLTTKYELTPTAAFANEVFGESDQWDTAEFAGLEPAGSTMLGLQWQRICDIYDQNFSKIVNASSNDEAKSVYDAMISEMEASGLAECEQYITEGWTARMQLWNNG